MSRQKFLLFTIVGLCLILVGGGAYLYLAVFAGSNNHGSPVLPTQGGPVSSTCGITKHSDGSYSYSWLHVSSDGKIVNDSGCVVPLAGFNMGTLFLGEAGGDDGNAIQKKIAWYKQTFGMNIVRINFNAQWWIDDAFVPNAHTHFRQWLQSYVKWVEQNGSYVELDSGPHYPEPPCGGPITHCPSQNQGSKDYRANPNPTTALELVPNIAPNVQAWKDVARLYANDPAVIYDALNEPLGIKDARTYFEDMSTLINTIRAQNPRALVIVYENHYDQIMSGDFPDYQQPNLVIDAHIYSRFSGISPATGQQCVEPGAHQWTPAQGFDKLVAFAHSHGHAVIINEWGGCYDEPQYHQQIVSFAKAQFIPLVYFFSGNVVNSTGKGANTSFALNANGRLVQAAYTSIVGTASG
jgi:hypothetical protein